MSEIHTESGEAVEKWNPVTSVKAKFGAEKWYNVLQQSPADHVTKIHMETQRSLAQSIILAAQKRNYRNPINSHYRFQHICSTKETK